MRSKYGSSPSRLTSYIPAGSVCSPTIKSNGICALVLVPGSCAEAVATATTVRMDRAKIVLRSFPRKLFLPLWVSDRSKSPSGLFEGSQSSPAASPFNEELLRQFIVTQRKDFSSFADWHECNGYSNLVLDCSEALETTEFIGEPILIPLGPE